MSILLNQVKSMMKMCADDYARDIDALSHEKMSSSFGGSARVPYDFCYEVAVVNRRAAARLSGGDPGPWPFSGWAEAPEEFRSPDAIKAELAASFEAVAAALEPLTDADLAKTITVRDETTPISEFVTMTLYHAGYHNGQLNYIQSLHGDLDVHWA